MNVTFSDRVRCVMQHSRLEAARLGHDYIGTEHLLLGLIREGKGSAVDILTDLGLKLEGVKQSIEDYVASSGEAKAVGDVPFTPRAKQILERAAKEAKELENEVVGTGHLLLALSRIEEGVAAQVLAAFGVDCKKVEDSLDAEEGEG